MKAQMAGKKTADKAVGRTRGGWNTKLHAVVDGLGNPVEFLLSAGNDQRLAGCKILCKRFSTKSRMALESRADSGLNPLITESHGGQSGMRAGTA